jgi:hypothetical protein
MSNRMTIAQFARLACELFCQLCCSFFKLNGALAHPKKTAALAAVVALNQ